MVSSTTSMMMILFACATAISEQKDWLKLQRSNPLTSISLIFGVNHQVIGDEEGKSNAIELAGNWLLENGVTASEIVAVEESFIEVNVPIAVAEELVGANYYDYQNEKDGNIIIQRINDENEFVIPQSAVHFLDYVWPTVLREEENIMEEFAWAEGDGQEEEEGDRRRLASSTWCSSRITAASLENCGEEGYSYCAQEALWWCQSWATGTRARTCSYTIWRHDCPCCKGTSSCDCTEYLERPFGGPCLPRFDRHKCAI